MEAQPQPPILLTRPAPQSARFAAALGRPCLISPLIAPRFLSPVLPRAEALILTSETGAEAAARLVKPGLAFCVGDRTAEVARGLGFEVRSARGDAEALVALILSHPPLTLLHARGREARGEVAARLTAAGRPTAEAVVYAQEPRPLSPEAEALLTRAPFVLVPLFSPRSATLLAAEVRRLSAPARLRVVAMSAAVAEAARDLDPTPAISARPDGDSMRLTTLAELEASPLA